MRAGNPKRVFGRATVYKAGTGLGGTEANEADATSRSNRFLTVGRAITLRRRPP